MTFQICRDATHVWKFCLNFFHHPLHTHMHIQFQSISIISLSTIFFIKLHSIWQQVYIFFSPTYFHFRLSLPAILELPECQICGNCSEYARWCVPNFVGPSTSSSVPHHQGHVFVTAKLPITKYIINISYLPGKLSTESINTNFLNINNVSNRKQNVFLFVFTCNLQSDTSVLMNKFYLYEISPTHLLSLLISQISTFSSCSKHSQTTSSPDSLCGQNVWQK